MANALNISGTVLFQAPSGNQLVQNQTSLALSVAPAGGTFSQTIYNATTSETSPTTPGVTALGYVFFRNLDSTNFVEIGAETASYCAKLQAGDISLIKWDVATAIFIKANTANVALQIVAFSA